jgi:hypothetical protein
LVRLNESKRIRVLGANKDKEATLFISAWLATPKGFKHDGFYIGCGKPLDFNEIDRVIFELEELKSQIAVLKEPKSN